MPNEKSCGIVIFRSLLNERKYLVLHYEEGHWDFPKGHVEKGEEEIETALRETIEETGISDIDIITGFRERIEYSYKKEGKTSLKEVFFFLGCTRTSTVRLSVEHIGFEWLTYEMALQKLTYENAKEILRQAHTFLHKANKS